MLKTLYTIRLKNWGQSQNLILTTLSDQEYMRGVREKLEAIADFV